jgi:hypothetical protein
MNAAMNVSLFMVGIEKANTIDHANALLEALARLTSIVAYAADEKKLIGPEHPALVTAIAVLAKCGVT